VGVYPLAVLRIYRQEITGRNYKVTITQTWQYSKSLHTMNIYRITELKSRVGEFTRQEKRLPSLPALCSKFSTVYKSAFLDSYGNSKQ